MYDKNNSGQRNDSPRLIDNEQSRGSTIINTIHTNRTRRAVSLAPELVISLHHFRWLAGRALRKAKHPVGYLMLDCKVDVTLLTRMFYKSDEAPESSLSKLRERGYCLSKRSLSGFYYTQIRDTKRDISIHQPH